MLREDRDFDVILSDLMMPEVTGVDLYEALELVDPNLAALGPLGSWWNVTRYYFTAALPETWLQLSFFAGAVLILWRRNAAELAFLVGAVICFAAHPVTMKTWPHHIIPWLPFLSFVAVLPFGRVAAAIARQWRPSAIPAGLTLITVGLLAWALSPRLAHARDYLETSRARTEQIAEMNHWLAEHVPADQYLLVSYYAMNDDGFFKSMEGAGVRVPERIVKHRDVRIWWLDRSAIDQRMGFVCVSRADIFFFREDFERRNPGSTYNPFEDPRFQPLATFGGGFYELQVFKFDFRSPGGS